MVVAPFSASSEPTIWSARRRGMLIDYPILPKRTAKHTTAYKTRSGDWQNRSRPPSAHSSSTSSPSSESLHGSRAGSHTHTQIQETVWPCVTSSEAIRGSLRSRRRARPTGCTRTPSAVESAGVRKLAVIVRPPLQPTLGVPQDLGPHAQRTERVGCEEQQRAIVARVVVRRAEKVVTGREDGD